ncbi:MAG: hypothetical protein EKK40_14690 [Bradyrhizobiaceae bacterium]|nr:MAG: hypothetical protein EKK40_14690 [Bradyrhizobiaceae bacterium]
MVIAAFLRGRYRADSRLLFFMLSHEKHQRLAAMAERLTETRFFQHRGCSFDIQPGTTRKLTAAISRGSCLFVRQTTGMERSRDTF